MISVGNPHRAAVPTASRHQRALRGVIAAIAIASGTVALGAGSPASASLEWPSTTTSHPETVTADVLPTVQINGVAWAQEIVGNTVYVGGSFTSARPAGSPAGQNEVARSNFLAYDLTTGQLLNNVVFNANAQVRTIEKSPDGSRLYVGGDFTNFGGSNRSRIAVINTSNNTLTSFAPNVGFHVHDIGVTASTVYVGGNFMNVGVATRNRLAAFTTGGTLLPWAPSVPDRPVWALRVSPDGTKVAIGGAFETLNGSSSFGRGFAVVDATTGATLPFAATSIIRNGGVDGAITALYTDGDLLYGSGYTFGRAAGTLEGVFAAEWGDGTVRWVNDCHGDTYSIHAQGPVLYAVGHAHYCGNIGGYGQPTTSSSTWEFYRGVAYSKEPAGVVGRERLGYTNFEGQPRPDLLNFFPAINAGTYTGMNQGAWHVSGNERYVIMGGEFTAVNGTAQQGLVRYQTRQFAANDQGPLLFNDTYPVKVRSLSAGEVTISWSANRDRDDETLQYTVYRRTGGTGNGSIRHQRMATAPFWNRPVMTFTDTADPGGQYQYRVQVTDGFGNFANTVWTDVTVASSGSTSAYVDSVLASEPDSLWRLDESGGSVAADMVGWRDGTYTGLGITRSRPPATGDGNSVQFAGFSGGFVSTASFEHPPHVFSLEGWFRASALANGGLIVGFNNSNTANSGAGSNELLDRQLYMGTTGRVYFGVNASTPATVTDNVDYRDNDWHHVVGTLGPDGMQLFVDGGLVATRSDVDYARTGYFGYWRIGGGALNGFPSTNTSTGRWFDGFIDDVALYKKVLTAAEVAGHYNAAGFNAPNVAPTAAFQSSVNGQQVTFDASGSSDSDGTITNYAWNFGDGQTQNTNVPTVVHDYASPGNYTVTLVVRDNENANSPQASANVFIDAPNAQPVADFNVTLFGKDVTVDGAASSDSDGTIVNYRYDFGDGTPVVNSATPSVAHTYAVASDYTVTLTVTDNENGSGQVSHLITTNELSPPPNNPVPVIGADSFERTVVNGLGTADTGGAWTLSGSTANYSVSGGRGNLRLAAAGAGLNPYLGGVTSANSDTRFDVTFDKAATGGGFYVYAIGRRVGTTGDYRATVRYNANGTVTALVQRRTGTTDATLATSATVPGLTLAPGTSLSVRFQVLGTNPTQLALKLWLTGQAEPEAWLLTTSDSNAAHQVAGNVGVSTYISGSTSNAPVVVSVDNLLSTDPTAAGNATPTARFTTFIDGTSTTFNASASTDDAGIASYAWDFGDGGPAGSGQVVNHSYAPGVYTVTLTVTDGGGLQHSMSANIRIE